MNRWLDVPGSIPRESHGDKRLYETSHVMQRDAAERLRIKSASQRLGMPPEPDDGARYRSPMDVLQDFVVREMGWPIPDGENAVDVAIRRMRHDVKRIDVGRVAKEVCAFVSRQYEKAVAAVGGMA